MGSSEIANFQETGNVKHFPVHQKSRGDFLVYESIFSDEFKKQLKKTKKKDKALYERLEKKIKLILTEPVHLKHLKNILKGQQRVQLGPFVLKFELKENKIYFITLKHHDYAY